MDTPQPNALFASQKTAELEEQLNALHPPILPWKIVNHDALNEELCQGSHSHLFLELDNEIDTELIDQIQVVGCFYLHLMRLLNQLRKIDNIFD